MRSRLHMKFAASAVSVLLALSSAHAQTNKPASPAVKDDGNAKDAAKKDEAKPDPAATTLTIDLAHHSPQFWPLDAGKYAVSLVNVIPGEKYSVLVGASAAVELPVLPSPSNIAGVTPPGTSKNGTCDPAIADAQKLVEATRESAVPSLRQKLNSDLLVCPESETATRAALERIVADTVLPVPDLQFDLPADSRRTLTIVRGDQEWQVTLSSAGRVRYQTLFGWMFAAKHDDDYVSTPTDDKKFKINLRSKSKHEVTSLPSVFFTRLSTDHAYKEYQHGPTLGFGVTVGDSGRPAVFAGYMVRHEQNLGFAAGVVFYPHHRLDDKYSVDKPISEDLDSSQLNHDHWLPNIFFGFVARFGSDPRKAPDTPKDSKPAASSKSGNGVAGGAGSGGNAGGNGSGGNTPPGL